MLHLLLLELCNRAITDIKFLQNNQIRQSMCTFFSSQTSLVFKARRNCSKPSLWSTVTAAVRSNDIQLSSPLPPIYLTSPGSPVLLPVSAGGVDLLRYFCHKPIYQGIMILSMSNTELCAMCMRNRHPYSLPITNPRVDVNRLTIASSLQTKIPCAARNLWFQLIHNKVSSKVNLYAILWLHDDLCEYCDQRETTSHMLSTCPTNLEIWSNCFALVFLPLRSMDINEVYQSAVSLNLSFYRLIDSPLKVIVFEADTCIITAIRLKHFDLVFDIVEIAALMVKNARV